MLENGVNHFLLGDEGEHHAATAAGAAQHVLAVDPRSNSLQRMREVGAGEVGGDAATEGAASTGAAAQGELGAG